MGKALFADEPDSLYRVLAALVVASVIVFVDVRTDWLAPVRGLLMQATEPVVSAANLPVRTADAVSGFFSLRSTVSAENERLRQENLVLQRHVQQLAMLKAENARLRQLLNSSSLLDSSVLVAEIIGLDPDPSRGEVIINKGAADGVYVGQPVLDAHGVLGQVVLAGNAQSRLILLTDRRHGVPVEVNRNGVRAIAQGTGPNGQLQLLYLPVTADIREGDLLSSSGLGGVFPRGYPVGTVGEVTRSPGESFLIVTARPSAAVTQSRQVLLVFTDGQDEAAGQAGPAPASSAPGTPDPAPAPVAAPSPAAETVP